MDLPSRMQHVDFERFQLVLRRLFAKEASLTAVRKAAQEHDLDPATFAVHLEAFAVQKTPEEVWQEVHSKLTDVMYPSVAAGRAKRQRSLTVLSGDWASRLKPEKSILGHGAFAFAEAIGVQEHNAGMGLVSAAPTGGASGTLPATLHAVSVALKAPLERQIEATFVAGLVGLIAFGLGPVSGAQAGCGGEIGVAAGMSAGGAVWLFGGGWEEIDAAAALATNPFIGLECSPARGVVEYPCVPRNGFAALCAIAAAEAACAGIRPPYSTDYTLRTLFRVGRLLPEMLREREDGDWAGSVHGDREEPGAEGEPDADENGNGKKKEE